jgi:hypothetical protein
MAMTYERALAFRLPSGKTIAEGTKKDFEEVYRLREIELFKYENTNLNTASDEELQRLNAYLDRMTEFEEAIEVINRENERRGRPVFKPTS